MSNKDFISAYDIVGSPGFSDAKMVSVKISKEELRNRDD